MFHLCLLSFLCDEGDVCMPAGVVVTLARKYRVSLPVLTAVAQVLNGHLNVVTCRIGHVMHDDVQGDVALGQQFESLP